MTTKKNLTIEGLKAQIKRMQRATFNVAVECAYFSTKGVSIPKYFVSAVVIDAEGNEVDEVVEIEGKADKKDLLSYSKLALKVDYSKATITAWINAVDKIISEGLFELFATDELHFNADKINLVLDEANTDVFADRELSDLLAYSYANLKKMVDTYEGEEETTENEETTNEEETEGENAEGEGEETTEEETVETALSVDGKLYKGDLPKSVLADILEKYFTEVVNEEEDENA